MNTKSSKLFIIFWSIVACISGYFILSLIMNSIQDRLALLSFLFSIGYAWWGFTEQKANDSSKNLKDTKNYILGELEELKMFALSEIKEIKHGSEKKDSDHDNSISLLTQKIDSLAISFNHHLTSVGHQYSLDEILKLKEKIDYINAIVNVQAKYADVHLRLLKLESERGVVKDFKEGTNESLSNELKSS